MLALRDRAMCAMMLYGFVRVGALVRMRVRDFEDGGEFPDGTKLAPFPK